MARVCVNARASCFLLGINVLSRVNRVDNEPKKFSREAGVWLPPAILDSQNIWEFPGIYGNLWEFPGISGIPKAISWSWEFPLPLIGDSDQATTNDDEQLLRF